MEITGKVLREVEFRDRLRGYDTDEVDEFLEQVAVAVDDLYRLLEQQSTHPAASQALTERAVESATFDDDSIRRTLVLAQRTADLAIQEAKEEAARLVEDARHQAEDLVAQASATAQNLRSKADEEFATRISAQLAQREQLERDVRTLNSLVSEERDRLADSLQTVLRYVTENLSVSQEVSDHAQTSVPVVPDVFGGVAPATPLAPTERLFDENDDLELADLDQIDIDPPSTFTTPTPTVPPASGEPSVDTDEELWQRWARSDEFDDEDKDDPTTDPFGFDRRP